MSTATEKRQRRIPQSETEWRSALVRVRSDETCAGTLANGDPCRRTASCFPGGIALCYRHFGMVEKDLRAELIDEVLRIEDSIWRHRWKYDDREELSTADVADWLNVTDSEICRRVRRSELPHFWRNSGGWGFYPAELSAWVKGAPLERLSPWRVVARLGRPGYADWSKYWSKVRTIGGSNGYRS